MNNPYGIQPSGTFTYNVGTINTFSFDGTLFRCVLPSHNEPLNSTYSQVSGGRWNPAGSFPVLYTFTSPQSANYWIETRWASLGFTWEEVAPERLPDLAVVTVQLEALADVATDAGLQFFGLPATYPVGFETPAAYAVTRPIGVEIHARQVAGLVTRSATARRWQGPIINWGEVAIFTEYASPPTLVERLSYLKWTGRG